MHFLNTKKHSPTIMVRLYFLLCYRQKHLLTNFLTLALLELLFRIYLPSDFLKWNTNSITVKVTAMKSAIGSAIYTPVVLSPVKVGTMQMSGRRSTSVLTTATITEESAKVIRHAI